MKTKNSWLAGLVLVAGACVVRELPLATPTYRISAYERSVARRQFDQCNIQYAFRNGTGTVSISALQKQLEIPFDHWADANGFLTFTRVAADAPAEISIVFTDTLKAGSARTTEGLLRQPVGTLSALTWTADSSAVISLLASHPWDVAALQRVLQFQIGAALGLATTGRPSSVMAGGQLNTTTLPDSLDISAIRRLYNQPCDQWRPLKTLPFNSDNAELAFVVQDRAFVLIGQELREYLPDTDGWPSRRSYPETQKVTFAGQRKAFVLNDRAYVGDCYETFANTSTGPFWQYLPATNEWQAMAPLPRKGNSFAFTAGIGGYGYVATMLGDSSRAPMGTWRYSPVTNQWALLPSGQYLPPGWISGYRYQAVVHANQLFVLTEESSFYTSLVFDPTRTPAWSSFSSPPAAQRINSMRAGLSVRGRLYALTDFDPPTNFFRYEAATGWKRLRDFPGGGRVNFVFAAKNRAYIGTSTGEFWEYKP